MIEGRNVPKIIKQLFLDRSDVPPTQQSAPGGDEHDGNAE